MMKVLETARTLFIILLGLIILMLFLLLPLLPLFLALTWALCRFGPVYRIEELIWAGAIASFLFAELRLSDWLFSEDKSGIVSARNSLIVFFLLALLGVTLRMIVS